MGLIGRLLDLFLAGQRNLIAETTEIFRENAESGAARATHLQQGALAQFAAEFAPRPSGWFDRAMDGVNRLPRPALALGTLGLFLSAMIDPLWFAARMQGIALVPEPLWWLLGVIVSFYFGARHQMKAQSFHREIAATMALAPSVVDTLGQLQRLHLHGRPGAADDLGDAKVSLSSTQPGSNAALEDWKAMQG